MATPANPATWEGMPVEIRVKIYRLVDGVRVVVVDHSVRPTKQNNTNRRTFVREAPPLTLHISRESRNEALSRYGAYLYPAPSGFTYTGERSTEAVNAICEYVGVPDYTGSKIEKERKLVEYVNERESQDGVTLSKLGADQAKLGFVPVPQWFDPKTDTLIIYPHTVGPARFLPSLWQPKCSVSLSHLSSLTLVFPHWVSFTTILDPLKTPAPAVDFSNAQGVESFSMPAIPSLKTLVVVDKSKLEVFAIELDTKGLLNPDQWAYSLASYNSVYAGRSGLDANSNDRGIQWNVTLGVIENKSFLETIGAWDPVSYVWHYHRGQTSENEENEDPDYPKRVLLSGWDTETYLGPSWEE